jgi:hypothetical protein
MERHENGCQGDGGFAGLIMWGWIYVEIVTGRREVTQGEHSDMISIRVSNRQCWRLVTACVIVGSVLMARAEVSAESNATMDKVGMVAIEEDVMAPDFTVKTVSGDTIKLSSMKGKVVLLNFWATW